MNAPLDAGLAQEPVAFRLNGRAVAAAPGETIIETADRLGVEIPRLCYKPGYRPDGNCRACMVEIAGERVLAPACCRAPSAGMEVASDTPRAVAAQKMIVELLAADMPQRVYKPDSELAYWQRRLGVLTPRFAARAQPVADLSHPAMAVNLTPASSAPAACGPAARSRSTTSSATPIAARPRPSCSTSPTRWAPRPV
jgi:formate dehydrogenase major subunit